MNERGVGVWGRWRNGVGRAATLAACAGTLWLAGCGEDPDERTLNDASIQLASLSAGAGTPIPDRAAETGFKDVISKLQGLTGGSDATAADASVMVSAAQRGLALRAAGRAVVLQRAMLTMLPPLRTQIAAWEQHNSDAKAAANYDPAPEFARIDRDVRARQDDLEKADEQKRAIESKISGLMSDVASRLAEASKLRDQAGSLQLKIAKVSATEGLELTKQIRELTRKADALEMKARELKAQADSQQIELHAAKVSIDKLGAQIKLLQENRASVQTHQAEAQKQAAAARGHAQQAATWIAALVDTADGSVPPMVADTVTARQSEFQGSTAEIFGDAPAALTPFVEQAFTPAIEDASGQLQTATQTAKKATSLRRSSAQIAVGEAQQSLGDVHWTHAAGLDAYAQVLEELANATPALPASAEYVTRAKAAREASTDAKRAAFEAYQAAKSAYEASGAKADVAEQLDEVGRKLNEISRVVGAGVMDAEAMSTLQEPAPEQADEQPETGAQPAPEQPAAGADPADELKDAIRAVVAAGQSGDYDTVVAFMHPATGDDQAFVDSIGALLKSVGALDSAAEDAFGATFSKWLQDNPDPMLGQLSQLGDTELDPDTLDIRVQGDEAVALTGNPMMPQVKFQKVGGQWKQVMSVAALTQNNPMAAASLEAIPKIAGVYDELASEVTDGTLGSNAAVAAAFKAKLMGLMQNPGGG